MLHPLRVLALVPAIVVAQTPPTLDRAAQTEVVDAIRTALLDEYVFLDVARACADHLQQRLKAGAFDGLGDPAALAKALTTELQAISKDKHMRVIRRRAPEAGTQGLRLDLTPPPQALAANHGFAKVEVLPGNIGYVEITGWAPSQDSKETIHAVMRFLADVDALIVDERRNGGGSPDGIRYFTSYLFDTPTHLNSLYYRKADRTEAFWTLPQVPGRRLADVPVFVLTSGATFSGGEEFAYNLKTRKRATLVGEVTGGGANPGGVRPLPHRLGIFVPGGRAINPITQTNWEGVGVEPDIPVSAEKALEVALEKAREAAKVRQEARAQRGTQLAARLEGAVQQTAALLKAGKAKEAEAALRSALPQELDEATVNQLGYACLSGGLPQVALQVFTLNVERFPTSANAHDSLGEALAAAGQTPAAIQAYRKALALQPGLPSAQEALARLAK